MLNSELGQKDKDLDEKSRKIDEMAYEDKILEKTFSINNQKSKQYIFFSLILIFRINFLRDIFEINKVFKNNEPT